ncbi:trafficking protein particle complex subunit 13 isoform X1 [Hydra vulgaris]|uniref:trafficking protein particle complex subunit 13 isoform X1 n=1 Tax=Hydra vulgaris TaxID=6087 RepID=UPI001F5E5D85|nr:trafficking protein particle complex subunit 13 [Hydra vulgaris]
MQDQVKEKDHLLVLKVMRLTKPSIKSPLHVTAEEHDFPGDLFYNEMMNDISALKGAEEMAVGEILSLPQAFGSIYLGETFSCYISILNDSNQCCKDISVKTDMQTATQRFQLTAFKPKDMLSPDQSVDDVISYEVKELGTHILICAVTYSSQSGEKLYMRRFYKFQVLKPLEVKTKFYNGQNDLVFLEAQVQNITTSNMCMEQVTLEPSQYYHVQSLNFLPKDNKLDGVYGCSYMNPMDTRQYLFKLLPKCDDSKEMRTKPPLSIGKLDIVWRTNFGETGRLQTSQLQRMTPSERDVKLVLIEAPDVVSLEKQFQIKCRLENSSPAKIEAKLFLTNPHNNSMLWCGISGKILGPLPQGSHLDITLLLLAIRPGFHSIGGVRIQDLNSSRVYEFDDIFKLLVCATCEIPF